MLISWLKNGAPKEKAWKVCCKPYEKCAQNMPAKAKIFPDTSVIFAAVLSPKGGPRLLFRLGEIGMLDLWVGQIVLSEADEVVRSIAPQILPDLAFLLSIVHVSTGSPPGSQDVEQISKIVDYLPNANILAE